MLVKVKKGIALSIRKHNVTATPDVNDAKLVIEVVSSTHTKVSKFFCEIV